MIRNCSLEPTDKLTVSSTKSVRHKLTHCCSCSYQSVSFVWKMFPAHWCHLQTNGIVSLGFYRNYFTFRLCDTWILNVWDFNPLVVISDVMRLKTECRFSFTSCLLKEKHFNSQNITRINNHELSGCYVMRWKLLP